MDSQGSQWTSFDWWRGEIGAVYGRPPSPFPASFETPRVRCRENDHQEGKRDEDQMFDDNSSKLSWPACRAPNTCTVDKNDTKPLGRYGDQRAKKTKVPLKRPAWIPPSNFSKTNAIFHPPPYTNRCKETRFNTNKTHPMKLTFVPKLKI